MIDIDSDQNWLVSTDCANCDFGYQFDFSHSETAKKVGGYETILLSETREVYGDLWQEEFSFNYPYTLDLDLIRVTSC